MPEEITFENWLKYLFDRPVTDPEWYWEIDDQLSLPPHLFIEFGTRMLLGSGLLLNPYSDGQVRQGLYPLISNLLWNDIYALHDATIPLQNRLSFLNAIVNLNQDCFEPRCTPHLSHLDRDQTPDHVSPLNGSCFMWWDIFILWGNRDDPAHDPLNRACLQVMEQSLALPNIAVQEGALHGLGHFAGGYPDEVRKIIESFLNRSPALAPQLLAYATRAIRGDVP